MVGKFGTRAIWHQEFKADNLAPTIWSCQFGKKNNKTDPEYLAHGKFGTKYWYEHLCQHLEQRLGFCVSVCPVGHRDGDKILFAGYFLPTIQNESEYMVFVCPFEKYVTFLSWCQLSALTTYLGAKLSECKIVHVQIVLPSFWVPCAFGQFLFQSSFRWVAALQSLNV